MKQFLKKIGEIEALENPEKSSVYSSTTSCVLLGSIMRVEKCQRKPFTLCFWFRCGKINSDHCHTVVAHCSDDHIKELNHFFFGNLLSRWSFQSTLLVMGIAEKTNKRVSFLVRCNTVKCACYLRKQSSFMLYELDFTLKTTKKCAVGKNWQQN